MEFNKPPTDYNGPQRRRTEFGSLDEKIDYDANGLIKKAILALKRERAIEVNDVLQFAQRKDDVEIIEQIGKAVERILESDIERMHAKYVAFINGLNLFDEHKEKLKEMMNIKNFNEAVATAQELDPECKIPSNAYAQIVKELMTHDEHLFRGLFEMMLEPTVQLVANTSFKQKVAKMEANVDKEDTDSPYSNIPLNDSDEIIVSIDEGAPYPKSFKNLPENLGNRYAYLAEIYGTQGMTHIGAGEMATLYLRTSNRAKKAEHKRLTADNWENGNGPFTILASHSLALSDFIAYSTFIAKAEFWSASRAAKIKGATGRASKFLLKLKKD